MQKKAQFRKSSSHHRKTPSQFSELAYRVRSRSGRKTFIWLLLCVSACYGYYRFGFPGSSATLSSINIPAQPSTILPSLISKRKGEQSIFAGQTHLVRAPPEETKILEKSYGFNLFDRLYLKNGIIYIVTSQPEEFPDLTHIFSNGKSASEFPNKEQRFPTDEDIQMITPLQAKGILGEQAIVLNGFSIYLNDAGHIFLDHYYHLICELFLGVWKIYTQLDPHITESGETVLPAPSRMIVARATEMQWRDGPRLNPFFVKSVFPGIGMEYKQDMTDRSETGLTYVFERVVLVDRAGGEMGPLCGGQFFKPSANTMFLPEKSPYWWMPIRRALLESIGGSLSPPSRPVITYVSRQSSNPDASRQLNRQVHSDLVAALEGLGEKHGWEINVPNMVKMSKAEQFKMASRTTVMLGIHGNGLSHQLWMKPTPFSTVIEIFKDQGWSYDYSLPAMSLGFKHFGIWNDTVIDTSVEKPHIAWPEGFHSSNLIVDPRTIVNVIETRLKGWTK